jgi:predicted phosphodiesterase
MHEVVRPLSYIQRLQSGPLARWGLQALVILIATVAGIGAFALAASATRGVGPVTASVHLTPAINGGTTLALPPLGRVGADTHAGPLAVRISLESVDLARLEALATNGTVQNAEVEQWIEELKTMALSAAARGLAAALAFAAFVAVALTHRAREALVSIALTGVLVIGSIALAATTFDQQAFREPTFEGALTYAPAAFSLVQQKVTDIRSLQREAKWLAADLASYYGAAQSIAPGGSLPETYRVLHVSDTHLDPVGAQLAADLAEAYDVAFTVDTGDLAYFGTEQEAKLAASQLHPTRPYYVVPGNHDSEAVLRAITANPNVHVIDDETTVTARGLVLTGVGDPAGRSEAYEPDPKKAAAAGRRYAEESHEATADIVAVHSPASGEAFEGLTPLVLSGHTHRPSLDENGVTIFLGAGTTGGVTFGDNKSDPHVPHSADILYYSAREPHRLVAIDQIEVYGKTKQSSIRRTVIDEAFVRGE